MTLFSSIPLKRFFAFWIVLFIVWYGSSLLFYAFWNATGNAFILFVSQIFTPVFLLLAGWLYFRKLTRNDWAMRFTVAGLWVGMALILTAILMQPVYGVPWTYGMLSQNFALGQLMNVVGIMIGGYVAETKKLEIRN